jgi:hypothetical protein
MSRLTLYDHLGLPKVRYPYLTEFEFMLKELQHYKDLEEQGRLIELPCAVGDTVWFLQDVFDEICKAKIIKLESNYYTEPSLWIQIEYVSRIIGEQVREDRVDLAIGKYVFLTKEEAEAKLNELKGEKHEL